MVFTREGGKTADEPLKSSVITVEELPKVFISVRIWGFKPKETN